MAGLVAASSTGTIAAASHVAESSQHAMLSDVLDAGTVQQNLVTACTPWCFQNSLKLLHLCCKLVLQS